MLVQKQIHYANITYCQELNQQGDDISFEKAHLRWHENSEENL